MEICMPVAAQAPRAKRLFPGANVWSFRRDALNFLQSLVRTYGDIVQFSLGNETVYLFSHPDHIKDILVTNNRNFTKSRGLQRAKRLLGNGLLTSEGEFHRRQRRLSQPAFHRERIAGYADVMVARAAAMRDGWRDGETHDIAQEMMRLTLEVVAKTLFDAEVKEEMDEIGAALTTALELFTATMTLPFYELLEKLPLRQNKRFQVAKGRLDATIYRIIEERRRSGRDHGDLLSMLLMAQDDEGDGGGMTDEQLRDEAMTIFLAGHETTANALAWTWNFLAQHPEIEARMHAEIDQVLSGRTPTMDDFPKLKYTEMIFAESMRVRPPVWIIGRRAIDEYEVGGYTLPARSICLMSQYIVHNDARWHVDPERFDPERWTPERRDARPKFSYFPFGGGPRQCIGESFAWTEGALILATLAQRWRLAPASRQPVAMQPLITLRPRGGLPMTLRARRVG
jgi:cytochrome P450